MSRLGVMNANGQVIVTVSVSVNDENYHKIMDAVKNGHASLTTEYAERKPYAQLVMDLTRQAFGYHAKHRDGTYQEFLKAVRNMSAFCGERISLENAARIVNYVEGFAATGADFYND